MTEFKPTLWQHLEATFCLWSSLRKFGSTKLARATIAIPVIGYLIIFNNDLSPYLRLVFDSADASPPVHLTRLYFLYFGFSSIAIGSAIFAIRCPKVIKEHGTPFAFLDKELNAISDMRLGDLAAQLNYSRDLGDPTDRHAYESRRRRVLDRYFENNDQSRLISRLLVTSFYCLGGMLVAVPTAETFWRVLMSALGR